MDINSMDINVNHQPDSEILDYLGVFNWPTWTKETSEFPWTYDAEETCYFLEGDVEVTSHEGLSIRVGKGDLVTFPAGLSCTWKVVKPVKKHYKVTTQPALTLNPSPK